IVRILRLIRHRNEALLLAAQAAYFFSSSFLIPFRQQRQLFHTDAFQRFHLPHGKGMEQNQPFRLGFSLLN
ncbi:MAG: hypothetical protein IJJ60_02875, partial [Clostridia bacterium]|nr:hypothetical protein [Clostridia bacterium]